MSRHFDEAWEETGRAEGGYVDDPSDSGGETNWGITKRVARQHGYTGSMKRLSKAKATEIAKRAYWDSLLLDDVADIAPDVAREVFDTGFNMGQSRATKFLQRALNALNRLGTDYDDLIVDGDIGAKTIKALKAFIRKRGRKGEVVLLRVLNGLQCAFYVELVERREKDEKFFFGWVSHRIGF